MEVRSGLERIQNVDSKEPDGVKNGHELGERKILSFTN